MAQPVDGSPEWHDFRRKGLGGSDLAAIAARRLGFHSHGSEWEVYLSKIGKIEDEETDSYRARYGRAVEFAVCKEWAKDIGAVFIHHDIHTEYDVRAFWEDFALALKDGRDFVYWKPPSIVHPEHPILRGNPDALAVIDGVIYLVEIKTTGIENRWEWEDEPPARVLIQGTYYGHILRALGVQVEGVISLCEINHDPPIEHRTPYAPGLGHALEKIALRWWRERIEGGVAPPLDGSGAADKFIDANKTRTLDEELDDDEGLIADYYVANEAKQQAEYDLNVIKQKIKQKLSGAAVLRGEAFGKKCKVTNKPDKNGKVSMRAYPPRKP